MPHQVDGRRPSCEGRRAVARRQLAVRFGGAHRAAFSALVSTASSSRTRVSMSSRIGRICPGVLPAGAEPAEQTRTVPGGMVVEHLRWDPETRVCVHMESTPAGSRTDHSDPDRGAYMITATPARQIMAPVTS